MRILNKHQQEWKNKESQKNINHRIHKYKNKTPSSLLNQKKAIFIWKSISALNNWLFL